MKAFGRYILYLYKTHALFPTLIFYLFIYFSIKVSLTVSGINELYSVFQVRRP